MQLILWVPCNGHGSALQWMPEVAMTAPLTDLSPTVGFDDLDDLAHLHGG
jgi:hypothetical protein